MDLGCDSASNMAWAGRSSVVASTGARAPNLASEICERSMKVTTSCGARPTTLIVSTLVRGSKEVANDVIEHDESQQKKLSSQVFLLQWFCIRVHSTKIEALGNVMAVAAYPRLCGRRILLINKQRWIPFIVAWRRWQFL